MIARDVDIAWLAGLWDGEGSVGVSHSYATGRLTLIPQVQINMTHLPTIERAIEVWNLLGIHAIHHTVQEKLSHHKDSYHVGFGRTTLVKRAAEAMIPYAVTKRPHWELAREICDLRIARQRVTPSGNLRRGGPVGWAKPYSERELELALRLKNLNTRPKAASAPLTAPGVPA